MQIGLHGITRGGRHVVDQGRDRRLGDIFLDRLLDVVIDQAENIVDRLRAQKGVDALCDRARLQPQIEGARDGLHLVRQLRLQIVTEILIGALDHRLDRIGVDTIVEHVRRSRRSRGGIGRGLHGGIDFRRETGSVLQIVDEIVQRLLGDRAEGKLVIRIGDRGLDQIDRTDRIVTRPGRPAKGDIGSTIGTAIRNDLLAALGGVGRGVEPGKLRIALAIPREDVQTIGGKSIAPDLFRQHQHRLIIAATIRVHRKNCVVDDLINGAEAGNIVRHELRLPNKETRPFRAGTNMYPVLNEGGFQRSTRNMLAPKSQQSRSGINQKIVGRRKIDRVQDIA